MRTFFYTLTIVFVFGIFLAPIRAKASIIINEIMYDTPLTDDGREWIEAANTGIEPVDLTGWKLFEANVNHGLSVSQGSMEIAPGGFVIIADNPQKFLLDWPGFFGTVLDSAFSLSNTGEALSIKDAQGAVVDTYTYSLSLGAGGDGDSLQLVTVGWIAQVPTPGEGSEILLPPEEEIPPLDEPIDPPSEDGDGDEQPQDPPLEDPVPDDEEDAIEESPPPPEPPTDAHIIINEIMYDAPGSDAGHEWIELFNMGPSSVDIAGWKFTESDVDHTLTLVLGSSLIDTAGFAVVAENAAQFIVEHPDFTGMLFDSSFSLSNTGETLAIKDTEHVIRSDASYDATRGASGDGSTLQYFDAGFIAALPTPGAMNVYDPEDQSDEDSNGSSTGEGAPENDNAPYIEEQLTPFNVIQAPTLAIEIKESDLVVDPATEALIYRIITRDKYSFVQIENPSDAAIDISRFVISFAGKTFTVPIHTLIAPDSTMVIAHAKARFAGANRAFWSYNVIQIE